MPLSSCRILPRLHVLTGRFKKQERRLGRKSTVFCAVRKGKDSHKMSEKEEVINRLKKRVKEIRDEVAKDQTDDEITQKITDIFNGKVHTKFTQPTTRQVIGQKASCCLLGLI